MKLTGDDLRNLRLLHGLRTQEITGKILEVSGRTVKTYEASRDFVSDRVINLYREKGFNVDEYGEIKKKFCTIEIG